MEFFVVEFEERAADVESTLLHSSFSFLENELEDSWYDANLIFLQTYCGTCPHSVSLSTASLPVSQNSRVKSVETP